MQSQLLSFQSCCCSFDNNAALITTPLLPKNFVLIREVCFGERENHMHSQYLLPKICVLYRGVPFLECLLREGPLYTSYFLHCRPLHLKVKTCQKGRGPLYIVLIKVDKSCVI